MKLSNNVFSSTGTSSLTESAFYALLGGMVTWGLGVTAVCAHVATEMNFHMGLIGLLVLGLGIPILGIFMTRAENIPVAFLGYNLICAPFGFVLSPMLNQYSPNVVLNVALQTAAIAVVMGFAGVTFPGVFSKLGSALFFALIGLIVVQLVSIFVPSMRGDWISIIAAGIFSLYIGYDMWRASTIPQTAHSAIQVAAALYMDIINLFVNLLSLSKRN